MPVRPWVPMTTRSGFCFSIADESSTATEPKSRSESELAQRVRRSPRALASASRAASCTGVTRSTVVAIRPMYA